MKKICFVLILCGLVFVGCKQPTDVGQKVRCIGGGVSETAATLLDDLPSNSTATRAFNIVSAHPVAGDTHKSSHTYNSLDELLDDWALYFNSGELASVRTFMERDGECFITAYHTNGDLLYVYMKYVD